MNLGRICAIVVLLIGLALLLQLPLGRLEPFAVPVALVCAGVALLWDWGYGTFTRRNVTK